MITIGNVGSRWRASVTAWGAVEPWDGTAALDWWVAADDRWHTPAAEPAVRQRRLAGAPVVETAVRVPSGDAIHRVYATAHGGGLTVVEVENASPLPFAVAFSPAALRSARPPTDVPIAGIDLPPGAVVFPVGHRATLRVALPHDGRADRPLDRSLPSADEVARGWVAQTGSGVRFEGLDELAEALVAARAALLLEGPGPAGDREGFLLGLAELVRLGQPGAPWVLEVAQAAIALGQAHRRTASPSWDVLASLDAVAEVLRAAGEDRGALDVAAIARRLAAASPTMPADPPEQPARLVAWVLRRLVRPAPAGAQLVPEPLGAWHGRNLAVYGAPVPGGTVSFALRWHGERPALLWDTTGTVALLAPGLDPSWSTTAASGETLLAGPS